MNEETEQQIKIAYIQGKIDGLKEGRVLMDKLIEDIKTNNAKLFTLIHPPIT